MRTTIDIRDELLRRARKKAADEGLTLKEVVEAALQLLLAGKPAGSRYRFRWTTERGRLRPGVNLDDRDALFDLMDGRR
jgi:hypothetical protein